MTDKKEVTDLANITTDELIIELNARGYRVVDGFYFAEFNDSKEEIDRIYEDLYIGRNQQALEKTKKFVSNVTGRILPC